MIAARSKTLLRTTAFLALVWSMLTPLAAQDKSAQAVPPGFTSMFDGKTLKGWKRRPDGLVRSRTVRSPVIRPNRSRSTHT